MPSETRSWPRVSSTSKLLTKFSVLSLNSDCLLSESSWSVKISISKLVSLDASLTFCPLLPIALLKFSSVKITSILLLSLSINTFWISAGDNDSEIKVGRSSVHFIISIFSPCSSLTIVWTLLPRIPTQAPTGSIELSFEKTHILALLPGSLATALISIMPS